jgi:hypothetical protein
MLARVEPETRERLEAELAPLRICEWVAGGKVREDRDRRANLVLWLRKRIIDEREREGWPDLWELRHFYELARTERLRLRDRGLAYPWPVVQSILDRVAIPLEAPPPKRLRKLTRNWNEMRDYLRELMEHAEAQAVKAQAPKRRAKMRDKA